MERAMSVEDKIRRAEQRYYMRREQEMSPRETRIGELKRSSKKKDIKLFKKMIKQIIVCLFIYGVFYLVVNSNYIFSEDFTNKAKEILSQDINFAEIYSAISSNINDIYNKMISNDNTKGSDNQEKAVTPNDDTPNNEVKQDEESKPNAQPEAQQENSGEQVQQENVSKEDIQNNQENIGGAAEETEVNVELSQMEKDVNYIKSVTSFIKPVNGTISSMFGPRNPTTASVPKNHTGTDIAAVTGTKIVSSTDGTVIYTSSQGDFGNHLKIQINDVIILYAHCNKIYVKEGDIVKQGQEIAEVGSTGNTTGPHLHFEVIYQDRRVNPQLLVEF